MGFLSGLLGNVSEVDVESIEAELNKFMAEGEYIDKAYKVDRDVLIFTNRRLILADKQALSGRRMDLHSLPYRSILQFAVESSGRFDADAELKIWIAGEPEPMGFLFKRGARLLDVQRILAGYVLS